jgi:hypothetical protein
MWYKYPVLLTRQRFQESCIRHWYRNIDFSALSQRQYWMWLAEKAYKRWMKVQIMQSIYRLGV